MECRRVAGRALIAGLVLLCAGCGGGGGGDGSTTSQGQATPVPGAPTATETPLRATSSRNERTESNDTGSMTLRIQSLDILSGSSALFSVFLYDANGDPIANKQLAFDTALRMSLPNGDSTRADGSLSGAISSPSSGRFALTVGPADQSFGGLSVTLTVVVNPSSGSVATATPTLRVLTPTPPPCTNVAAIIMQTDIPNVTNQSARTPRITAVVLDSNNHPLANTNVQFDLRPQVGTLNPLSQGTDGNGVVQSDLRLPANASVGVLTVTASACGKTGGVAINIVSGTGTNPVTTVVLQANPRIVSSDTGGTVNLTAVALDADNAPVDGVEALFVTSIGTVNPLIDTTKAVGSEDGTAQSSLQIPVDAASQSYTISVVAGGITGSTTVRVLPSGGTPDVPSAQPAFIALGASPNQIQVAGAGGTELARIIGRVFDKNGDPLANVPLHYHIVVGASAPGAVLLPLAEQTPGGSPTPSGSPTPIPLRRCAPDDAVSVSDSAGFALIQVRAGTSPGPVTIAACAETTINGVAALLIEQQTVATVTSGPAYHIALTINSRSVDNNDGALLSTINAVVTDAQGNPVQDGTAVSFEVLARRVCSGGPNDGQSCDTDDACNGGSCVNDPADPSGNVVVSSKSLTNGAPPCDTSQFVVQTGLAISSQPGDAIACVKFPSIQQGSEVVIRASVGAIVNNLNGQAVTLPGRVGDLEVSVSPNMISLTNTTDGLAVVRASVSDTNQDPVQNVRVRFTTSVGTIDRSILTGEDGDASATLTIPAGTASGTAIVRVSGGGLQINNVTVPYINTSGAPTPTAAPSGQPAALRFVGALPDTIGVRGSGLPVQSTLTFQVVDGVGTPLSGIPVNFSLAKIADERISTTQGVTGTDGNVHVTLSSGNRALAVQITAQIDTPDGPFTVRSTPVTILGGPPSQPNFSLAHQFDNISGRVTYGLTDLVTAFVGDRFGNPVPPGTAVSFTTKGGAVGNFTTTNALGQASATLVSQAPIADTGIVATLATTQGERPFTDHNGNGVCDEGDDLLAVTEPFYDANCNGVHDSGEDFIDLNGDFAFNDDQGPGTRSCDDPIVIFQSLCTTFSGRTQVRLVPSTFGPVEAGGSRDYTLIVSDNPDPIGSPGVGNPIVGGSTIAVTVNGSRGRLLGFTNLTTPDAQTIDRIVDGINRFSFSVVDNTPESTTPETDTISVTVTSASLPAGGNGSVIAQDFITFQPLATATPTVTPSYTVTPTYTPSATPTWTATSTATDTPVPTSTPTWTATATPTTALPAILPSHTVLFAGLGAAPSTCNGTSQTFIVTGGSPPFTIAAPSGCLDTTTVMISGGSFTFTAGDAVGDSVVTATDVLGRTITAGIDAEGVDAAFLKIDLVVDVRSDNGDGSFSSVLGALVTDSSGVTVADGVPVEFSLVNPVSGVSVTSPGFTHQAQPCEVSFTVVPQPGDALSCIKYVQSLQGSTITVRARVRVADGGVIEDIATITLPDTRPTRTPTVTGTPTNTGTATMTPTFTAFPTGQATFTPPDTATPTPTIPVGSLVFVSAQPATIGVRASGLPEQAVLTFQARNTRAQPIAGAPVQFQLTGSGSEILDPITATTDANGLVTTTVTSGTRATTVRVTASADSNGDSIPDIFVQSQVVSIVGAPPAFNHFSVGPAKHNLAGRITLGLTDTISVFVNDRFGNAVPPGTAVSFITNAASIVNPSTTDSSGIATATLLTEGIVPPSGTVTVLAFTRGEESFLDNNGNGRFDCVGTTQPPCTGSGIDTILTDDVNEPFIDYRPLPAPAVPDDSACTVAAPSALCNNAFDTGKPFELFVDSGTFDGLWGPQGTTGVWDNNIFVWATTSVTFSGPLVTPVASPNSFTIANGGSQFFTLEVHDDLLNPLVGGSTITVSSSSGTVTGGSITIPDGQSFNQLVDGLTRFGFVLSDDDPSDTDPALATALTVTISSQNGTGTFVIASGTVD